MSNDKSNHDHQVLKRLKELRTELYNEISMNKISQAGDLSRISPVTRRGMIHTAGDMFELTKLLSPNIKEKLDLNNDLIKGFRNKVAHRYGEISDI